MTDVEAAARLNKGKRYGEWVIVDKLDEGGFGQVYKVEHRSQKGKWAALKAEPNEVEGGSAIKLEITVLNALNTDGDKPHVPVVYQAAKHKKFCYMVMTLLGENLKNLKLRSQKELMTVQTWSRIAVQCLYSIKFVHDYGFVHRDIKPNNFVLGHKDDPDRARIVHILDFGLARSYASFNKAEKKWVPRRARGSAEFRGTLRYCSPNVHLRKEQGRHDDLWSLFYVLMELHTGLPWQHIKDKTKIEITKMEISDETLVVNMPVELHGIIPYLRKLNVYQRPDYSMFYKGLTDLMKRIKVSPSEPYDWETPEQVEALLKQRNNKPHEWENAEEFFKSDPVGINGPPNPSDFSKSKKHEGGPQPVSSQTSQPQMQTSNAMKTEE